jgi:ATP-dependent DNA helicase RecQ
MSNIHQILKQYFGFDRFRPLQEQIIRDVLSGKNVLVLMPTGGGKSVCYQVPALAMEGTALVISPLIALMKDQVNNLTGNGVAAAFINSSQSPAEEQLLAEDCLRGKFKLLYLSPEKALALTSSWLPQLQVSMIAIDEAHCISQWGHDFRPEYTRLSGLRDHFPGVPVIALTATADKTTRKDIVRQLGLNDPEVYVASFDRPNLRLEVRAGVGTGNRKAEIADFIRARKGQAGIVYCLSRKSTEEVSDYLNLEGIGCAYYHAGMTPAQRNQVQEAFSKDDIRVICATIAFGMGIDKSNIRFIIHYNIPRNMEGYYQEIGRAGRDGMPGNALLYYNLQDLMMLTRFADESGQPELNREKLRRMQEFAEARICRRRIMLNYFSEQYTSACGNCDVCSNPPKVQTATVEAQKALSALVRSGEKIGVNMLINILRGSKNAELLAAGYHQLKTYGAGREHAFETWQGFIRQFLQLGLIEIAYDEAHALKVTPHGWDVISGKEPVAVTEVMRTVRRRRFAGSDYAFAPPAYSENTLFDKLRDLRKLIADSEGVAAYQVFTDKTLHEMSVQMPVDKASMLEIPGVSVRKFERYGADFIMTILEELPPGFKPQLSKWNNALTPDMIRGYIGVMEKRGMRVSAHTVGKILLGSDRDSVPEGAESLPFFGSLKSMTTYKVIGPLLRDFFREHVETGTQQALDTYFGPPVFNNLVDERKDEITGIIASLPFNRPDDTIDNEYILNQRKTHPRSYEHWYEPEVSLFSEIITLTNDLDCIGSIFQRSPDSLKSYYKKIFSKQVLAGM